MALARRESPFLTRAKVSDASFILLSVSTQNADKFQLVEMGMQGAAKLQLLKSFKKKTPKQSKKNLSGSLTRGSQ